MSLAAGLCLAASGCENDSGELASKDGYCEQVMALDQAFAASQDQPENATPQELAALAADEARRYEPILVRLVATAPRSVLPHVRTFHAEMARMAETGDDAFLDSPDYGKVNGAVHEAAHERCGYQKVTISASDYTFEGVPKTLKAGRTSFLLRNRSQADEPHVAVIARLKDGAAASAADLAREGEAVYEKLELPPVGGAFATAGQTGGLIADLAPGHYYVFCDIPTGGAADGAPHSAHGMVAAFRVI